MAVLLGLQAEYADWPGGGSREAAAPSAGFVTALHTAVGQKRYLPACPNFSSYLYPQHSSYFHHERER